MSEGARRRFRTGRGGEIEQVPEELGVEAAQRAGAGALVLGLRESSTKRRAVTDGAIRASEFCMLTGIIDHLSD